MPATLRFPSDDPNLDPNLQPLTKAPDYSLEERARRVGAALGRMVAAFRHAGIRIKQTASEATDTAASQIAGAKQQIRSGYADTKARVKSGYADTKSRAQILVRDYPLHVVLGAGLFGVVLGAGLRIWRGNR